MPTMRDEFWNAVYEYAVHNRDIVLLSADFSAPSLDQFRLNLPAQYVKMGITEQAMILVASGMAIEGKHAYCYAIAPFLTMRCLEQIRLYPAAMNLPVVLVGVGAGFSYGDSGMTHHALEDISILRSLPNMRIFQPCDNATTREMVKLLQNNKGPVYVRLDRYAEENLIGTVESVSTGINVIRPPKAVTILTSGYMVKTALAVAEELEKQGTTVGILDACILPVQSTRLQDVLQSVRDLVVLEEHTLPGGLGSYLLECISDLRLSVRVTRIGADLRDGYCEEYSGRTAIHRLLKLDVASVVDTIKCLEE